MHFYIAAIVLVYIARLDGRAVRASPIGNLNVDTVNVETPSSETDLYENLQHMERRNSQAPSLLGDSFKNLLLASVVQLPSPVFYPPYASSPDNKDWSISYTFNFTKFPSASIKSGGFAIAISNKTSPQTPYTLTVGSIVGFTDASYLSSNLKFMVGRAQSPGTCSALMGRLNFPKAIYKDAPPISSLNVFVYFLRDESAAAIGTSSTTLSNAICIPNADNMIECEGGDAYIPYLPRPEWSIHPINSNVVKRFSVAALVLSSDGKYNINTDEGFVRGTYRYMINKQKIFDTVTNFSKHLKGASVGMITQFNRNDFSTYNKPSVMNRTLNGLSFQNRTINGRSQRVISQKNLETYLTNMLNNKQLKYAYSDESVLDYGTSTIVPIHLGPGIQVNASDSSITCRDLCAFHETVETNLRTVHYTVIPYPDSTFCPACIVDNSERKSVKIMASHEFFETMAQEALGKNYFPGASEISDPCSWDSYDDTKLFTDTTFGVVLQKMWDFNSKQCVTMKD